MDHEEMEQMMRNKLGDMMEAIAFKAVASMNEEDRDKALPSVRLIMTARRLSNIITILSEPGGSMEEIFARAEEAREIADYMELVLAGMESFVKAHPELQRCIAERGSTRTTGIVLE